MLNFHIITLFPEMFSEVINTSMLKKARDKKLVKINLVDLRKFGLGKRKKVDDTPYGGGGGMVLRPGPIFNAVKKIKSKTKITKQNSKIILLTPQGKTYSQESAERFSKLKHIILLCGHYEGFDERIRKLADVQISIGDYVLTGGEIPALAVVDSVTRLLPGVRGAELGLEEEPFTMKDEKGNRVLEYPHYTRPEEWEGMKVPKVLLSGNHAEIKKWRMKQTKKRTPKG